MKFTFSKSLLFCFSFLQLSTFAQKKETVPAPKEVLTSDILNGLSFRSIGSATTSGRVVDFAVNPTNRANYFLAAASGGVWRTENAGTTYEPVFESYGAYSIGCLASDPNNFNVLWVGTGENNNQRSVAYGDGIYKSEDGGKSFTNMGLKNSEHIGKIIVDPRNADVVYVAAYGPVWSAGGDRGIYKTTDGGKTWKQVLFVSEHTGFNEVHFDPKNPDVLYATAHQRRRHEHTYISGGPESALYKSTDAGATWKKLTNGLPKKEMGRIGLAISPVNSDYVYAIVEAQDKDGGLYLSTDRGASFSKQSDYTTAGNYYQEIYADPNDVKTIYAMDVYIKISTDAGKSFKNLGEKSKHVDNHALWIDAKQPNYIMAGCDGGVYETYDGAKTWHFKSNLSICQYYKVEVDNATPFYNVYGGTQDNNSMYGPSRTISKSGIVNADWVITNGGDGFESQIDPNDHNLVYAQSQYGGLVRHDKRSGETIEIKPIELKGDTAYRWNWDAPLAVSKHQSQRIYFCANKVFKSEDRGNTWSVISPDLSRGIDRNKLTVMGKVWSMDAVAKNQSTSIFGNIVAFSESPKNANLLYAGTDDGLVHVSSDMGKSWTKIEKFAGVPDMTYVNALVASQHDENVVYAAFNNHKNGDFKPYIFKSSDKGKTYQSIVANLPERGSVYSIAEDHLNPNLLFAGTEFGLFCTIDGGKKWTQLKAGLPTIAIRDIAIQKRENDLVLASFGRGFYILDDYTPLQTLSKEVVEKPAHIFPVKEALMFMESSPLGHRGKSFQGESFFTASNPPVGAVFTYYLKETSKTAKQQRQEREKELNKNNQPIAYPTYAEMQKEDREEEPFLLFQIADEKGNLVRNLKTNMQKGVNRLVWDFRHNPYAPIGLNPVDLSNPYAEPDLGPWAVPGNYKVSLYKNENGVFTKLVSDVAFTIKALNAATLVEKDRQAVLDFTHKVGDLSRAVAGTYSYKNELQQRIKYLKVAIVNYPTAGLDTYAKLRSVENKLADLENKLSGNTTLAKREFETMPGLYGRVETIIYYTIQTTCAPTSTFKQSYEFAYEEAKAVIADLKKANAEVGELEKLMDKNNIPYTPGRLPELK
ncbi:MAG: glycosyl hydrolase [Bacteroidota bacterium]